MKTWMFFLSLLFSSVSFSVESQLETKTAQPEVKPVETLPKFNDRGNWGFASKGINAQKAHKISKGNNSVLVAIVDTGVDFSHPDLKDAQWKNPKESGPWTPANKQEQIAAPDCFDKSCNKIDDDKNGYVDDVSGYDFALGKSSTEDTHGHGTHIAGIIAGKVNEVRGVGGIAPNVKIASYRYYALDGAGKISAEAYKKGGSLAKTKASDWTNEGLRLAIKNGAKIINYSGGGTDAIEEEKAILMEAEKKGILVVVAAGNESTNFNQPFSNSYYPCAYKLSNIICVGNLTKDNEIPPSSNSGNKFIDVFAPGTQILSTAPGDSYAFMTGTSQATAFVTGLAALMYSMDPSLTFSEVRKMIAFSAKKHPLESLKEMALAEGSLDAELTLRIVEKYGELKIAKKKEAELKLAQQKKEAALKKNYKALKRDKSKEKYSRSISAKDSSSSEKGL